MGIQSEYEELARTWKDARSPKKIVMAASFFVTVGTIASISDVVFAWKGFILTGIQFYRSIVTTPLANIALQFDLDYDPVESDLLILGSLLYMSLVRDRWLSERTRQSRLVLMACAAAVYAAVFAWGLWRLGGRPSSRCRILSR